MGEVPRLLTPEELAAMRARFDACGGWDLSADNRAQELSRHGWGPNDAAFLANAPLNIPALLAHVAILEGMLADVAADDGSGLLLKYRRALEMVVNHWADPEALAAARLALKLREAGRGGR